jgi:surfeit locus 1 family protein
MQFNLSAYIFKFKLWQLLLVILLMGLFVKLGFWQLHKAQYKQHIEETYQVSLHKDTRLLRDFMDAPEQLEFQKVMIDGRYETKFQFLVDNVVENGRAGFYVITPFKIANSERYVLVNRGWIAGKDRHYEIPSFSTSNVLTKIEGMVWIPSNKIFTLENASTYKNATHWEMVWQNLDMKRFKEIAPIKVLSIIIKLDPKQAQDGFVRNWQLPQSRIMTNLSYAYQWFGFAIASALLFLYTSIKKEIR